MIGAGMEAILIKVAGIGLTTQHLGKTLSEMHPILLKLVGQGSNSCNIILTNDYSGRMNNMVLTYVGKAGNTRA